MLISGSNVEFENNDELQESRNKTGINFGIREIRTRRRPQLDIFGEGYMCPKKKEIFLNFQESFFIANHHTVH